MSKDKKMRVAVYGTLRKGDYNSSLLKDAKFIEAKNIRGYEMYSLGPFPAVTHAKNNEHGICVEVYEIDENMLERLDILEGLGSLYFREEVANEPVTTYIYFMPPEKIFRRVSMSDKIEDGDWLRFKNQKSN